MLTYMVTTLQAHGNPAHANQAQGTAEPFCVIVEDEHHLPVAQMDAMSRDHARLVAGALLLLLPKLDPGRSVVLDASVAGIVAHSATPTPDLAA